MGRLVYELGYIWRVCWERTIADICDALPYFRTYARYLHIQSSTNSEIWVKMSDVYTRGGSSPRSPADDDALNSYEEYVGGLIRLLPPLGLFPALYEVVLTVAGLNFSIRMNTEEPDKERRERPTDISRIPEVFGLEEDEEGVNQAEIMAAIIRQSPGGDMNAKAFQEMSVQTTKLSKLRDVYEKKDRYAASVMETRRTIEIDEEFILKPNSGRRLINTDRSMIDYHMTVGKGVGFSTILPNAASSHTFEFNMDLKKPCKDFKGKHAMLGFDPCGRMLFVGRCNNEEVYLAMVPLEFLSGGDILGDAGATKGTSIMSRRHYRQVVMMLAYFLDKLEQCAYYIRKDYDQDLDCAKPMWSETTNVM